MAGWHCGFDKDDDVLNLNLFARKSFGFQGIPKEKENILKKIVTHIGASCDDYPKYIFTSIEHYNSLSDVNNALYNVTYIRDCVDANRCLTVEHYKFGPKYSEQKDYGEFEPCCANFHNGNEACLICDPTFKTEVPTLKTSTRKTKTKSTPISKASVTRINKNNKVPNSSVSNKAPSSTDSDLNHLRKTPWEPWENRMLIDYLICNKLIMYAKGHNVYRKMISEGFLKHRTVGSMRIHFRTKILRNIESYDLPPEALKEFKKIKNQQQHARTVHVKHRLQLKKIREMNKKRLRLSAKES